MALQTDSATMNSKTERIGELFEYDVTRNLDRRFICPICLGLMRKPMQTKCGHRFCSECILAVIGSRDRTKCPVDNSLFISSNGLFLDLAFEREINSLSTSCPNKKEGCDWFAELTLLKEHINKCPCGIVTCEDCKQTTTRKKLSDHKLSGCPLRIIQCEHCKQQMPEIDKMKHHVVKCQKFPVNCTQCGQTGFQRDNIAIHADEKTGNCPATIIPCYYQPFGCIYMDQRRHIMHHLTRAAEHHHVLLVNEITRLEHRLMTVQHEFTNHLVASHEIKTKLQDVQRSIGMNDTVQKIFKENYSGSILWQVDVTSPKNRLYHSPAFYTANPGYRVSASLEVSGNHKDFDSFVSFNLTMEEGKYDELLSFPFSGLCQVTVFDQSDTYTKCHHSDLVLCRSLRRFYHNSEKASFQDSSKFMKAQDFLSDRYIRNGTVFIEVKVMQSVVSLLKTAS